VFPFANNSPHKSCLEWFLQIQKCYTKHRLSLHRYYISSDSTIRIITKYVINMILCWRTVRACVFVSFARRALRESFITTWYYANILSHQQRHNNDILRRSVPNYTFADSEIRTINLSWNTDAHGVTHHHRYILLSAPPAIVCWILTVATRRWCTR
jgi:hypothetical protein